MTLVKVPLHNNGIYDLPLKGFTGEDKYLIKYK